MNSKGSVFFTPSFGGYLNFEQRHRTRKNLLHRDKNIYILRGAREEGLRIDFKVARVGSL